MNSAVNSVTLPRNEAAGDTVPAALFDLAWEPTVPGRRRVLASWNDYIAVASQVVGRFHGQNRWGHFDYQHPTRLQPATVRRLKRPYKVSVAYAASKNARCSTAPSKSACSSTVCRRVR